METMSVRMVPDRVFLFRAGLLVLVAAAAIAPGPFWIVAKSIVTILLALLAIFAAGFTVLHLVERRPEWPENLIMALVAMIGAAGLWWW